VSEHVTATGLVPEARTRRTRKPLADLEDAAAGTRGQFPLRTLEAQPMSGPGAPVNETSTVHRSPHSRQRSLSCMTPIRWATEEMPKRTPANALHRGHSWEVALFTATLTSRRLPLPIPGQPSRHEPTVGVRQVASDRSRKASKFTSTSHLCPQSGHRTVRRMRSGRLASVLARNEAPGLRPHAGQGRAFAESDGLGESMRSTLRPKVELDKRPCIPSSHRINRPGRLAEARRIGVTPKWMTAEERRG
jgi:hypothetical protein